MTSSGREQLNKILNNLEICDELIQVASIYFPLSNKTKITVDVLYHLIREQNIR